MQNPVRDARNEITRMTEASLDKLMAKINSKNDLILKKTIKTLKFTIENGNLSPQSKRKLVKFFIQNIVEDKLGNDNIFIFPLISQLLSSGIGNEKLEIEWKPLYNTFTRQFLSHSKITQKTYPQNYFQLFLQMIASCTSFFTEASVDEILKKLASSMNISDPLMPTSFALLCTFLPPYHVEKWMNEILDIYMLFNHETMDLLVLPLLIRTFSVCKDYDISGYVPNIFSKLATIRTNDLSFQNEIEQFCYERDSKQLFAKLFAILLTTKAQDIVIVNLQKYMTIIESDLTLFSFVEQIIDFYSEIHVGGEIEQCFIAILLPMYIHGIYTHSFKCTNLSKLIELAPGATIPPLLNTLQLAKDKISMIYCLKEMAPVVAKTKESIEGYLLQITPLLDSISSVDEEYTILILQTYAAFTKYYHIDETLVDWATSLFSILTENAQVVEYDHDVLVLIREVLMNIASSLDISVMWTLLDNFGDCFDSLVGLNVTPFADSLPISSYADLCLSEVNLQNAVVIYRLIKTNGNFPDMLNYIQSTLSHGDAQVRAIGRKILTQVIRNCVETYPHFQLDNGKVQWNKPTGEMEIVRKIFEQTFSFIKANFNGKDFQTQVDFLETTKALLKAALFDKEMPLEVVKWLTSIQIKVLHSNVVCKIIECLAVPYTLRNKNFKPNNEYQAARIEQAALNDYLMKFNEDIAMIITDFLFELMDFQNEIVIKSVLNLATKMAHATTIFFKAFPRVLEVLKEKKTKQFAELAMVFVENCNIQEQFNEVVDFTLIIAEVEKESSEIKNRFITFLDSIDFYTEAHDTDAIFAERNRLVHSSIAIYNEKKTQEIQNFVIAIVCALLDGKRAVLTPEVIEFAKTSLLSDDITIRRLSFEVLASAIERMIPRVKKSPEFHNFKLTESNTTSVYLTKEQQLSKEEMSKYFPDPENRVEISKVLYKFMENPNIFISDGDICFQQENFKVFSTLSRYFGHMFNNTIIEKSVKFLDAQTFEEVAFANEALCAVISNINFSKDEASKGKILAIIDKYTPFLVLPNEVFFNKDPAQFKWITDHIMSMKITPEVAAFSAPFIARNEELRNYIIANIPIDKSLMTIYQELAVHEPQKIFNRLAINSKLLISFISQSFKEQSQVSASLLPICFSHLDIFFTMLEEEGERNEDDIEDCASDALEGIASKFTNDIVPFLLQQRRSWSSQLSVFETISELFNSSVFLVDEYVNDIIIDCVIPGMMTSEKEVHNKAQRLLSLAFCRFNSLRESVDLFIDVFGKMLSEEGSSNAGTLGLIAIIEATPIFGEVRPTFVEALGVLTDISSSNQNVKDFLADFWRKYEGSFTSSSALALSPLKRSLKDDLQ